MANAWVPAGKVRFIVEDSIYNNVPCYYIEGKGKTLKNYDWFFRVRDKYASFVSKETLKPEYFIRRVREGDFSLNYDYTFDYPALKALVKEKKKDKTSEETIEISNCAYDLMTSVYYARAIDFNKAKVGDSIPIDIIIDKQQVPNISLAKKTSSKYKAKTVNMLNKKPNAANIIVHLIIVILLLKFMN